MGGKSGKRVLPVGGEESTSSRLEEVEGFGLKGEDVDAGKSRLLREKVEQKIAGLTWAMEARTAPVLEHKGMKVGLSQGGGRAARWKIFSHPGAGKGELGAIEIGVRVRIGSGKSVAEKNS
jgi:hypothetical protein